MLCRREEDWWSRQSGMERWRGKTCLVTGASSGIGEALVRRLSAEGLRVLGIARRADMLQELEVELNSRGYEVKCLQCDVTKEEEVQAAFACLEENWGGLNILINNAGVFPCVRAIDEDFYEKTKLAMEVNVLGVALCTSQGIQSMRRHGITEAHIVNINSVAGQRIVEVDGFIPYCASKHAVAVISSQLRGELARLSSTIRVTNVSPGLTKSEMADQFEEMFGRPKNILETEDVVDAIVYCLAAPPQVNISELTIQPLSSQIIKVNGIVN